MGELIIRAHDKSIESITGIHSCGRDRRGGGAFDSHHSRLRGRFRGEEGAGAAARAAGASPWPVVIWIFSRGAQDLHGSLLHEGQVVALDEELVDRIWHAQNERAAVVGKELNALEPTLETIGADALPNDIEISFQTCPQSVVINKLSTSFQGPAQPSRTALPRRDDPAAGQKRPP